MIFEESVGAVVFCDGEFLVLKYGSGHWGLVKGHIERGESQMDTLWRELGEETGIKKAEIVSGFKESIGYYFHRGKELVSKKVTYYLLKAPDKRVVLSHEHVDAEWLPFSKAVQRLTFQNTKHVLRKALLFL